MLKDRLARSLSAANTGNAPWKNKSKRKANSECGSWDSELVGEAAAPRTPKSENGSSDSERLLRLRKGSSDSEERKRLRKDSEKAPRTRRSEISLTAGRAAHGSSPPLETLHAAGGLSRHPAHSGALFYIELHRIILYYISAVALYIY